MARMTDSMFFPPGKLPVGILERLIRTYPSTIHGVVVGASIGEDAAEIDFGEKYLLAKTDPITFVAEVEKNRLITTGGARPGDDILLTKAIAIEGTSIMAREKGEELAHWFGEEFLRRCRNLAEKPGISVLEDARIAMRDGRVHSMHDPTEGGLANALLEVAAAADVGLVVEEDRIPILDEYRVLCRHYGVDPLGFIASGSLLTMVEPSDSGKITRSLEEAGVPAASIGRITPKEGGVKIRSEGRIKDLPRFGRDEIAKILERAIR